MEGVRGSGGALAWPIRRFIMRAPDCSRLHPCSARPLKCVTAPQPCWVWGQGRAICPAIALQPFWRRCRQHPRPHSPLQHRPQGLLHHPTSSLATSWPAQAQRMRPSTLPRSPPQPARSCAGRAWREGHGPASRSGWREVIDGCPAETTVRGSRSSQRALSYPSGAIAGQCAHLNQAGLPHGDGTHRANGRHSAKIFRHVQDGAD